MSEHAKELLQGGCDMHVHTTPSHYARLLDDFELTRELDRYDMAGAVIKNHFGATTERAYIANRYASGRAKLFGGLTLNWSVGGLNPYAVQSQLALGVSMIWMPTFHAEAHRQKARLQKHPVQGPGIRVMDQNGRLLDEVYEIMDLVKQYSRVLCSGHLFAEESYLLCREGAARGVRMMLTHPDSAKENVSLIQQKELAGLGVYIEKCWLNILTGDIAASEAAHRIRVISPDMCVMSTDLGQHHNGSPVEGLMGFIDAMLAQGIGDSAIRRMVFQNPRDLLS